MDTPRSVVIGTRGSPLALAQVALVREARARHWPAPAVAVERIVTTGDRVWLRPAAQNSGGAGL